MTSCGGARRFAVARLHVHPLHIIMGASSLRTTFGLILLLLVPRILAQQRVPGEGPHLVSTPSGASQLMVHGEPFLILGGELGNSSAGTAAQADVILPRLAKNHVNTALIPVAWEQLEPTEGTFDYSILDHWVLTARKEHMHLVLLWFGSWKNAFSNYAPAWVKRDAVRFPRAISDDGTSTEILSTLGEATLQSDSRAFAELLQHVRELDAADQTVLMVQVENEVGFLGYGRDRSAAANREFRGAVPPELVTYLKAHRLALSPELADSFHPEGKTWNKVFGERSDEAFMAWHYAKYIEAVTRAGKAKYALPMYVNAQLPAPAERAGEYPSGGPHPYFLEIYRAAAPSLDFFSPDIYWPNFEYWLERYHTLGNALFVPEARIETAPFNALYAYGQARVFGFAPFGIDSIMPADTPSTAEPAIAQTFGSLADLMPELTAARASGKTRGLVLHATSPRAQETIAIGGYLFEGTLSRSWPAKTLLTDDGAMIVIQTGEDEFFISGRGLTVSFHRDPDTDDKVAGIASIEEVTRSKGEWLVVRRLNGDQSNQGRQLSMAPLETHTFRVKLYTIATNRSTDK